MSFGFPQWSRQQQQRRSERGRQMAWWTEDRRRRRAARKNEERRRRSKDRQATSPEGWFPSSHAVPQAATAPPLTDEPGRGHRITRILTGIFAVALALALVPVALDAPIIWLLIVLMLVVTFRSTRQNEPIVGIAGPVDLRYEGNAQRLAFRVQRWDPQGKPLAPVAVVMKGKELVGQIHHGDRVEVKGRRARHGAVVAKSVRCVDAGQTVRMKGTGALTTLDKAVQWVVFLTLIGFFAWFIIAILSQDTGF